MDDYQMQELKALMKGQETYLVIEGGCRGLGMMCKLYRQQAEENRYYLREWSRNASRRSKLDELPGAFFVYGPGCRRDLSDKKEHGPRYVRGRIRWETNSTS